MSGPQPSIGTLGGADALLPPGTTGGTGWQQPAAAASGSAAVLPQPATGPVRPIVLPTPEGGSARLREPARLVGTGDDAVELRTRTAAEKEQWCFKKNLILWTCGLLVLGLTVLVLMLLGPL